MLDEKSWINTSTPSPLCGTACDMFYAATWKVPSGAELINTLIPLLTF